MLPLFGQESPSPVLFNVEDFMVKPSKVADFKEAIQEFVKIYAQNDVEYRWDTYQTEDFHFYFTIQMKNYDDVGKYFSASNELMGKVGKEKIDALNKLAYEATENYRFGLYYFLPELSYIPENYTSNDQESAYLQWNWLYILPEKQNEFAEIAAQWVGEYKNENISMPYYVWTGHIGGELPLYLYVWVAKSQEDFQNGMTEINQKLGEKTSDLRQRTFEVTKRMEIQRGWSLPNLSYIPEVNP
jgi:hypothetical protein